MKRLATCLIALVAFAAPAAAQASPTPSVPALPAPGTVSNSTFNFTHNAAMRYWTYYGYEVCPGKPTINYRNRYRPYADWLAWAWIGGSPRCLVTVNSSVNWKRIGRKYGRSARATYCAVIVHEYGHLAGLQHTRTGIMRGDEKIVYPAVCGY